VCAQSGVCVDECGMHVSDQPWCAYVCDRYVLCVFPTKGSFTVLACGELNDTPLIPTFSTSTTPLSSPQGFISGSVLLPAALVAMVIALSVTQDDAQRWA